MARNLSSDMLNAVVAQVVRPALFYEGVFILDQTIRLWTGLGDISWDGHTWSGNGWFTGMGDLTEGNDISASNFDVVFSGVPLSLISFVLGQSTHDCSAKVWLAMFDSNYDVIDEPYLMYQGTLSFPKINDSPEGAQISLTYVDELINLQRASDLRYTHASQLSIFPTDTGFEFVAGLANFTGFFGLKEKPPKEKDTKKGSKKR